MAAAFVPAPLRSARGAALLAATMLLVSALGASAVSWAAAERLVHPPRELRDVTPLDRGLAYERVAFASEEGIPLVGWWMPAAGEAQGTVVFLHGYGASKAQALGVAPFLHRAGYHVLAFDFRAHGESGGSATTFGLDETKDVRAALAYLDARGDVDMERIALFGWSMGAATAIQAAQDLPGVRALVADSTFARLQNVVGHALGLMLGAQEFPLGTMMMAFASTMAGRDVGASEPARAAAHLGRPMLLIQGGADPLARPDVDGRALAQAGGDDAELWVVPGAGHLDALGADEAGYQARVLAFLRAHLDALQQPSSPGLPSPS